MGLFSYCRSSGCGDCGDGSGGNGCYGSIVFLDVFLQFCPPRWPSGKASASKAEGPGFESRLRLDFFRG